jgi:hypothetical protein
VSPLTGASSTTYDSHIASPAGQRRRSQKSAALIATTAAAAASIGGAIGSTRAGIW